MFNGERYKIRKAQVGRAQGNPGSVLSDNLEIACGNNQSIIIKRNSEDKEKEPTK